MIIAITMVITKVMITIMNVVVVNIATMTVELANNREVVMIEMTMIMIYIRG